MPNPPKQTPALTPLHFEQDGAYFNFRDRPFYEISFDAETEDGMSLGCCPSFNATAPFHVGDFDMPGAILAREWFVAECARYGYDAVPAPGFPAWPVYDTHPACEAADMVLYRDDTGPVSVAEFVTLRDAAPSEVDAATPKQTFDTWFAKLAPLPEDIEFARQAEAAAGIVQQNREAARLFALNGPVQTPEAAISALAAGISASLASA